MTMLFVLEYLRHMAQLENIPLSHAPTLLIHLKNHLIDFYQIFFIVILEIIRTC